MLNHKHGVIPKFKRKSGRIWPCRSTEEYRRPRLQANVPRRPRNIQDPFDTSVCYMYKFKGCTQCYRIAPALEHIYIRSNGTIKTGTGKLLKKKNLLTIVVYFDSKKNLFLGNNCHFMQTSLTILSLLLGNFKSIPDNNSESPLIFIRYALGGFPRQGFKDPRRIR